MNLRLAGKVSALALATALTVSLGACATTNSAPQPTTGATTSQSLRHDNRDSAQASAVATLAVLISSEDERMARGYYVNDVHSYAQPNDAAVVHIDLDLTADFTAKTLSGTVSLLVSAQAGVDLSLIHI